MATFKEFCDSVLKEMPRATAGEKADVREELTDHLMEHRDMLVEHGAEVPEAERRAVEAMGDPVEIGRAWNEKLSPFWLWLGRIAKAAFITALICSCFSWYFAGETIENLSVRFAAPEKLVKHEREDRGSAIWSDNLDLRMEMGTQIVRITRVDLLPPHGGWPEHRLDVHMTSYAKNPFDPALNGDILMTMTCNGQGWMSGSGSGSVGAWYQRATFPVEEGVETIHLALDYLGNSFEVTIQPDWGGGAS